MPGGENLIAAVGPRRRRVLIALAAVISAAVVAVAVVGLTGPRDPSRIAVGRGSTTVPEPGAGVPSVIDTVTTTTTGSSGATTTSPTASTGTAAALSSTSTTRTTGTTTPLPTIYASSPTFPATTITRSTPSTTQPAIPACTPADLTLAATADVTPGPGGKTVEVLTLTETNQTTRACTALQGAPRICIGGGDVVQVSIADSQGADVYSAPPGGCSGPPAVRVTLGAGEVWSYAFIWDKHSCPGTAGSPTCPFLGPPPPSPPPPAPAGPYVAHAVWSTTGTPVTPPDFPFTIT